MTSLLPKPALYDMITANKGEIPFAVLIIPFIAGITCGLNFNYTAHITFLLAALVALAVIFLVLNIGYKYFSIYKRKWFGGILTHLILFLTGWVAVINNSELNSAVHFSKNPADFLVVKISSEPKLSGNMLRFTAKVEENISKESGNSYKRQSVNHYQRQRRRQLILW